MKGQNIIMVCQQNWNLNIGSNAKSLAREFAKQNQVLYVNMALDISSLVHLYREPEVRHKVRVLLGQQAGVEQAEPNLWVHTPDVLCLSANWVDSRDWFSRINRFNSQMLARSIRRAAEQIGFSSYYLFQDGMVFQALELPRQLRPKKFIYYLRDYTITVPYFRKHGTWVEADLLREADMVASNSAYLNEYARKHNEHHSYDIGQGCVLTLHQAETPYLIPADLAGLRRPLIGYTGLLTGLRLNIGLLLAIARQRPAWNLVLVGPEDENFRSSALHGLPNVFFLGGKTPAELPAYQSFFDVCINPQLVNEVTIGNYPLKIDEYLAMGKPVVATRTLTMELFQDHVYLADNEAQWLAQLEQALLPQDPARIRAGVSFAQSHTWSACVERIYEVLEANQ